MQQAVQTTTPETHRLFIPMQIKRRGGSAMIIVPEHVDEEDDERYYNEALITAFARAYTWQVWLKQGKHKSLAHICEKEGISIKHGNRLYQLNGIAPKIIEAIVDGTQPRTLCLRDFTHQRVPILWDEQLALFGFKSDKQTAD